MILFFWRYLVSPVIEIGHTAIFIYLLLFCNSARLRIVRRIFVYYFGLGSITTIVRPPGFRWVGFVVSSNIRQTILLAESGA